MNCPNEDLLEALDKILGQLFDADVYGREETLVRILECKRIAREAIAKARGEQ